MRHIIERLRSQLIELPGISEKHEQEMALRLIAYSLPQLLNRMERLEAVVDAVGSTMPYGILSDEVYAALDALSEEK